MYAPIETPTGSVNGTNRIFYCSASYVPGTVRVWINGQLKRPDLVDGWVEKTPNKIELKEAPRVGELVQVWYKVL